MDSSVNGILQARILEWVAFLFSKGSSQPRDRMNSGLLHCRWVFYQLSHKGSPRILEWVAHPFSSGSSWLRNQTLEPMLHADSLPDELSGRLQIVYITHNNATVVAWRTSCISSVMLLDSINRDSYRFWKILYKLWTHHCLSRGIYFLHLPLGPLTENKFEEHSLYLCCEHLLHGRHISGWGGLTPSYQHSTYPSI